jgi:hypothetical protein
LRLEAVFRVQNLKNLFIFYCRQPTITASAVDPMSDFVYVPATAAFAKSGKIPNGQVHCFEFAVFGGTS